MKVKCTKCGRMVDRSELAKRGDVYKRYTFCKTCLNIDSSEDKYVSGKQVYFPCKEVRKAAFDMAMKKYQKIFDECEKQGIVLSGAQPQGKPAITCETVDNIMKG